MGAEPKTRSNTLRQAASAVFGVTTVVPLLIFVWTLHRLDALSHVQAQVGLGLALGVALLGFHIFRRLMGQMSDVILALGKVLDRRQTPDADAMVAARAPTVRQEPGPTVHAATRPAPAEPLGARPMTTAPPTAATVELPVGPPVPQPASPPARDPAVPLGGRPAAAQPGLTVPGLGAIREVHDLSRAMAVLWQAEAARFEGRRVVVSVMNAPRPVTGTLVAITDDGLLLETEDRTRVAVSYTRIASVDAETPEGGG